MTPAATIDSARRLLSALETYRKQLIRGCKCCHSSPCEARKRGGYCDLRMGHCPSQVPPAGNWLPVEVAAQALERALGDIDCEDVRG